MFTVYEIPAVFLIAVLMFIFGYCFGMSAGRRQARDED